MKTYEIVRELWHMMKEAQPLDRAVLEDAYTKMFDLMVEEYEHRDQKATATAVKTSKVKTAADSGPKEPKKRKPIDWGKAEACRKAGWDFRQIADELSVSYNTIYQHFKNKEGTK